MLSCKVDGPALSSKRPVEYADNGRRERQRGNTFVRTRRFIVRFSPPDLSSMYTCNGEKSAWLECLPRKRTAICYAALRLRKYPSSRGPRVRTKVAGPITTYAAIPESNGPTVDDYSKITARSDDINVFIGKSRETKFGRFGSRTICTFIETTSSPTGYETYPFHGNHAAEKY